MALTTLVGVDPAFLVALTDKIKEQGHGVTKPVLHQWKCTGGNRRGRCLVNPFLRHPIPGYIKYLGKEIEELLSHYLPCIRITNIQDNGKQKIIFHLDDLYYIFREAGVEERIDRYCAELPYSNSYKIVTKEKS